MQYPIAIHKNKTSCYGITTPDLPRCFSAGDTLEEAKKSELGCGFKPISFKVQ